MAGVKTLIEKAKSRLNLSCYTKWERDFLASVSEQLERKGSLSEKQAAKLKQIILERWVQGKSPVKRA